MRSYYEHYVEYIFLTWVELFYTIKLQATHGIKNNFLPLDNMQYLEIEEKNATLKCLRCMDMHVLARAIGKYQTCIRCISINGFSSIGK